MGTVKFTKDDRQAIVKDFAVRHNGQFNPKLFLEEVRKTGEEHPAYAWFEWNRDRAAYEHQLWQAREFARDLKVTFSVETVGRAGTVRVVQADMPLVISPQVGRKDGGGYILSDPSDEEHMAEYCRQAAAALKTWLRRYEGALVHAGVAASRVDEIAGLLEAVQPKAEAAE